MSHAEDHEGTRRDFLYYATAGAGAVTAGAAIWPLINQMNPSADVQALSSIRVDVSAVEPGTQISVKFLGKPVFIRRRTEKEIEAARAVELAELPDQNAQNRNDMALDASDQNRTLDEAGEWLVMIGVCTHLG
ncbi:MAG: ubiquinol-cytochrome c reductase iron-sulfur subunit, partial [Roseovarius sp.]|nr:ubiquinol-cytochrome c reductase iron-sulfur subunit [Roseovarius sp.]